MQIGLVGQLQVRGAAVGLAEDGDRLDAQLAAGADDPQGNLTAVGNQDAFEHRWSGRVGAWTATIRTATCAVSTLNSG